MNRCDGPADSQQRARNMPLQLYIIVKKGSRSSPCNYIPVNLTSVVCKLMEHTRLAGYAHGGKYIVCQQQHGFCRGCVYNVCRPSFVCACIVGTPVNVDHAGCLYDD